MKEFITKMVETSTVDVRPVKRIIKKTVMRPEKQMQRSIVKVPKTITSRRTVMR